MDHFIYGVTGNAAVLSPVAERYLDVEHKIDGVKFTPKQGAQGNDDLEVYIPLTTAVEVGGGNRPTVKEFQLFYETHRYARITNVRIYEGTDLRHEQPNLNWSLKHVKENGGDPPQNYSFGVANFDPIYPINVGVTMKFDQPPPEELKKPYIFISGLKLICDLD